jgi:uncharacterized protein (DUF1800 family)
MRVSTTVSGSARLKGTTFMGLARLSCGRVDSSIEASIAAILCILLVAPPVPAAVAKRKSQPPVRQIQGDARVLHALNRLTFGPRPGDVAAVQKMGLDRWFEKQLHPSQIDDSALDARLAMFPAMKLQQTELLRRFPSPQVLRQVMQQRLPMPSDPVERAVYRDGIARYEQAKAKQEAAQSAALMAKDGNAPDMGKGADTAAALPGDDVDPATPAMATHEEQFYSGLEAVKIINLPPDERMRRILAMQPDELANFRKSLSPSELAAAVEGLTPEQQEILMALGGGPRMVGAELLGTRLLRDIYSQRQLEAVMTDFWLNHFNVYIRKNQNEPYLLPSYERDTIRPHALGRFEDLLVATAKSPAMLVYLDNVQSIGPRSMAATRVARLKMQMPDAKVAKALPQGLNENYARELMELHTLGVNGGYTQADVTQVAKVFTGWTVDQPLRGGGFQFEERRHEPGSKTVMGTTIHEGGEREGLQVLHMLATSPATARFISSKLAVRFVSDTPPPALVDRMAKSFLASDGDMATVLQTMFESPEFWSPEVYRAKIKTPLEFVVSAVRASDAEVNNPLPLVRSLDKLGMPLYGMQTPNGYSWTAEPWVSTGALVSRMNFAVALTANRAGGTYVNWTALLEQRMPIETVSMNTTTGPTVKELKLETILLGQPASEQTRRTVIKQLDGEPAQQQAEREFGIRARDSEPMWAVLNAATSAGPPRPPLDREAAVMAGLLLGSPEFQRR